jgi:hypothetical protein
MAWPTLSLLNRAMLTGPKTKQLKRLVMAA